MPVLVAGMTGWNAGRLSHWHGVSGRDYALVGEPLDSFAMQNSHLYVIAKGGHVLWVGSADDLVADSASRARFRLAMNCADRAFRLTDAGAEQDHLATIWDLEGASPQPMAQAQAA